MKKNSLQKAINGAFRYALYKEHEFIGVEHLLLALLNDCEVALFLSEQGVSLGVIHRDLVDCVKRHTPVLRAQPAEKYTEQRRTRPTQGFERVLQRASFLAECAGKHDVPTPYALLAIFAEHDSFALYVLETYGIKRGDVADYIEHRSYSAGYRIAQRAS
ncbi:MAG: Clp protease N-terminal domain-containing protein [Pseudomonadales bacterium]